MPGWYYTPGLSIKRLEYVIVYNPGLSMRKGHKINVNIFKTMASCRMMSFKSELPNRF